MSDKEIRTLAEKAAHAIYKDSGLRDPVGMFADDYENVIREILKTHDIVPKGGRK